MKTNARGLVRKNVEASLKELGWSPRTGAFRSRTVQRAGTKNKSPSPPVRW